MKKDMTTTVWFGNTKISIGDAEDDGDMNNMDFMMKICGDDVDDNEYCLAVLTIDEVEYLAHRMLDAAAYQRRKYGLQ
jgi:hypothetical protein